MTVKQAVFLVGGKGTRLGSLTHSTPKPLLEIAPGTRFLDVLIEEAVRQGFTKILLLAGYLGDQVEETYAGRRIHNAEIQVLREPEPQGTGGALKFAEQQLDQQFLLLNGDSFFDINLRALAMPLGAKLSARMALRQVENLSRYGAVEVRQGVVTAFREKNPNIDGAGLINAGIYLLDKSILHAINGPCSIEMDVFPKLVEQQQIEGAQFDGYFIDMGLPDTYAKAQRDITPLRHRPCAFLDRDGVLNIDQGYTHKTDDLKWIPGAQEAIRMLNDAGYLTIVVSNQAGIARGYYTHKEVDLFHTHMNAALALHGACINAFYYCPYHPDGVIPEFTIDNHPDRKPNPGMILQACDEWPIDMSRSFIIGDKQSDVLAGERAGISAFHFQNGRLDRFVIDNILIDTH